MNTQYSIIGPGSIGRTLAGLFAKAGVDVQIANSRGPDSMTAIAEAWGQHVTPVTLERALDADVIFLAVGFMQVQSVAAKRPDWTCKLVVDVTNALQPAEQLGFAPIELGWLDEGGVALHAAGGKPGGLLFQNLAKIG